MTRVESLGQACRAQDRTVEMSYTIHDDPQTVARIDDDLARICETVRHGDPALRALVLTGGFARGEGSVVDGAPQNDYDLVAIRGFGRPHIPYPEMRRELEHRIGLHIDLAPVLQWRIPMVSPSIFWYETALRGRIVWGDAAYLKRIPVRNAADIVATEALRLLVNRAAGLLLATQDGEEHELRIQASKAFLAVLDVHLLARDVFAPSHRERWERFEALLAQRRAPEPLVAILDRLTWAYRFKVDPQNAPATDAHAVWRDAAHAVDATVPVALRHAGLASLEAYAGQDGIIDHLYYTRHAPLVPGARRFMRNPTGKVRVATLRLLTCSLDGQIPPDAGRECLEGLIPVDGHPLEALEALRGATLQ